MSSSNEAAASSTEYGGRQVHVEQMPNDWQPPATMKLVFSVDIEALNDEVDGQSLISIGWVVGDLNSGRVFEKSVTVLKSDASSVHKHKRYNRQMLQIQRDEKLPPAPSHVVAANEAANHWIRRFVRTHGKSKDRHHPYEWIGSRRPVKEFWEHERGPPAALLEWHEQEALIPEVAMARFLEALDGRWGGRIKAICTDNPAYDLVRINQAFRDYTTRRFDVRYSAKGDYLGVTDPSEQMKFFPQPLKDEIWKRSKGAGGGMTHRPDDDAYDIFMLAVWTKRVGEHLLKSTLSSWDASQAHTWAEQCARDAA